jgi:signal transduction histidine kinase
MPVISKKKERVSCSIVPGLLFTIRRKGETSSPDADLNNTVQHQSATVDSDIWKTVLGSSEEIAPAVEEAFDGRCSSLRLRGESQGRLYCYELHCLPDPAIAPDSISCLLLDRTSEEEHRLEMESRIRETDIVVQAVRAFAETKNLIDILKIILLAVTAGQGLAFNRSFILLADEKGEFLHGCLATGPSSAEEAGVIWKNLERNPLSFDEALRLYKSGGSQNDIHVNSLITTIKIPLADDSHIVNRIISSRRAAVVGPDILKAETGGDLREKFGAEWMAIAPLFSRDSLQGVILADNLINGREITEPDLNTLEILAGYAADAVENSRLYQKLQKQIDLLQEANEKILSSRENLVKAEKLSSVARMASEMAHEIRNPLTIIGGFANSRLKRISEADESRDIFEMISDQSRRIETVLDRFSSILSICEKNEEETALAMLVQGTLDILADDGESLRPAVAFAGDVGKKKVFTDQNLFHQALAVILREASGIAGDRKNVSLTIEQDGDSAMIFVDGGDDCPEFAEKFYSGLSCRKSEKKYQEMAVALEILQHYGGTMGIGSAHNIHGRLFVEIPLCKEEQ